MMVALLALAFVGAYQAGEQQAINTANSKQLAVYDAAIAAASHPDTPASSGSNGSRSIFASVRADATFYITTHDSSPNPSLVSEGFVPNCAVSCSSIIYYKDPITVITNEGLNVVEYDLIATCASCSISQTTLPVYDGVSASSTTAAVTDTFQASGGAGPCAFNNLIQNSAVNSLAPEPGTLTGAQASSGTLTWTTSYTWTYAKGTATVNSGCLMAASLSGTVLGIFAEISGVGPFTLASGDTLTETWSVTIS